jgi:hypothetical protein
MRGKLLIVYLSTEKTVSEATTALHSAVQVYQPKNTKPELGLNMSGTTDWTSSWLK